MPIVVAMAVASKSTCVCIISHLTHTLSCGFVQAVKRVDGDQNYLWSHPSRQKGWHCNLWPVPYPTRFQILVSLCSFLENIICNCSKTRFCYLPCPPQYVLATEGVKAEYLPVPAEYLDPPPPPRPAIRPPPPPPPLPPPLPPPPPPPPLPPLPSTPGHSRRDNDNTKTYCLAIRGCNTNLNAIERCTEVYFPARNVEWLSWCWCHVPIDFHPSWSMSHIYLCVPEYITHREKKILIIKSIKFDLYLILALVLLFYLYTNLAFFAKVTIIWGH